LGFEEAAAVLSHQIPCPNGICTVFAFKDPAPTNGLQAPNSVTQIAVIADGQAKTVQLACTRYDSVLNRSIISKERAGATRGVTKTIPELSLLDSTGRTYISRSTLNARWHLKGGAQSFPETFYIVDSCGRHDAMLRKDITKTDTTVQHAYPFIMEKETRADMERRLAGDQARKKDLQQAKLHAVDRAREQYEEKKKHFADKKG